MRLQPLDTLHSLFLEGILLTHDLGKTHLLVLDSCLCSWRLSLQKRLLADEALVAEMQSVDEPAVEAIVLQLAQVQMVAVLHQN